MSLRNINDLMRDAIEKYLVSEPTPPSPVGQQLFTESYGTFVVPVGVVSICIVAIGWGGNWFENEPGEYYAGAGGGLAYANDVPVTPGESLQVRVQSNGNYSDVSRGASPLCRASSANLTSPGIRVTGLGFSGGRSNESAGGGAGGYTSVGGDANPDTAALYGGGGTSPLGGGPGAPGGGYPGATSGGNGNPYGGGAGVFGLAGPGCVRIIWGEGRAFPNTNTGDM